MTCPLTAICFAVISYSVIDGDTLRRGGPNIRIWGISAPERRDPGGPASTAAMQSIAGGLPLQCEHMDTDRFGRIVARCYRPDGIDLACAMVALGHAEDWPKYSGGYYRKCED